MSTLPPADDVNAATAGAARTGKGVDDTDAALSDSVRRFFDHVDKCGGDGVAECRSKKSRVKDGLVAVVREPGAVMVAAGTGILATVAGIDDVAEALVHVDHVNADRLLGAGASFIIGGTGQLIRMLLSRGDSARIKEAVDGNTHTVNAMRRDLTDMKGDIREMKTGIGTLIATNKRVAAAVESLASNINDLVDELRRGARPPTRP